MADKRTFETPFRRRKQGKTHYGKRLAQVKSKKDRLVVRKTSQQVIAEVVRFAKEGDQSIVFATSRELGRLGWKGNSGSVPAGYLTGLLVGKKAAQQHIKEAILDLGLQSAHHGGVLFAVAKGAIDAGLSVRVGEDALPSPERTMGKHIANFASKLNEEQLKKQFGKELAAGFNPKQIVELTEKTKQAILNGAVKSEKKK